MRKIPSKYNAAFDKILIVLSALSKGASAASFARVIGTPVGIASAGFSFVFSLTAVIIQKILKTTRNKKKKHNCYIFD